MSCTCVTDPAVTCIVHPKGSPMTAEEFKAALPDKVKKSVNQQLIDKINATLADPEMYEYYRENMLSYANVMAEGRFKVPNYIDAVKYCSHSLLGRSNIESYTRTFPEKIKDFNARGVKPSDIASYVSAYNKSKLVQLIMAQSLTPFWVLNQASYQEALNVQVGLMLGAKSEKVRSDAANSVLTHLKPPEVAKIELDITVPEDNSIAHLRDATMKLVAQQREALASGAMSVDEIAGSKLAIDAEFEEVGA